VDLVPDHVSAVLFGEGADLEESGLFCTRRDGWLPAAMCASASRMPMERAYRRSRASRAGRIIPVGGLARGELHAPPDPVQQHVHPGQGVLRAERNGHQAINPDITRLCGGPACHLGHAPN
jgi:hypothetical protein